MSALGDVSSQTANREGIDDFDIRWRWAAESPLAPGFTAVMRVKNEAESLQFVLPPLLHALKRVIVVDNESDDGTPDLARDIAERLGAGDRLDVQHYPFAIARCGSEHLETPPDSVHSLTYFYNWAFSLVDTSYVLKWDGDMVLTESGIGALRDLAWQAETGSFVVTMPRYALYVVDRSTAYLDVSLRNREVWGWPNRAGFEHTKAFEWELLAVPREAVTVTLPDWLCFELKHLDVDEFAHWSSNDFALTKRTARKHHEQSIFRALTDSSQELPPGLVLVTSPDQRHVVDYVRTEVIPREKPRFRQLHRTVRAQHLSLGAVRPTVTGGA